MRCSHFCSTVYLRRLARLTLTLLTLTFCNILMTACAPRNIVFVPPGQAVRLTENVTAKVETVVDGEATIHKAVIPAGWWCVPPRQDSQQSD